MSGAVRGVPSSVIFYALILDPRLPCLSFTASSTPGPNAPLSNACGNSTQPLANAYAAVASWTAAGMPAHQITLGVPAYGYLQMSSASSLIQRRGGVSPRDKLPHRKATLQAQEQKRASYVTVYNDGGGTSDGQVMFEELVSQGALTKDSSGEYVGAGGFVREWDGCSSTVSGDGFMARLQPTLTCTR